MRNENLPDFTNPYPTAFSVGRAQYAKGKYVVRPLDSRDGFKGPASYAADEIKAKWVHRSRGYTMSPAQLRRFVSAYETERAAHAEAVSMFT